MCPFNLLVKLKDSFAKIQDRTLGQIALDIPSNKIESNSSCQLDLLVQNILIMAKCTQSHVIEMSVCVQCMCN